MGNLKGLKRQLLKILQQVNKDKTVEETTGKERCTEKQKPLNFSWQWSSGDVADSWKQKEFDKKDEQVNFSCFCV